MPVTSQPATLKGTINGPNMFGAPPNNSNRQALSHNNFIQTNDATPVNNVLSPVAITTTSVVDLVVPQNAVSVTIVSAGTYVRISEVPPSGSTLSQYYEQPSDSPITLDVARLGHIYLQSKSANGAVSFIFQTM